MLPLERRLGPAFAARDSETPPGSPKPPIRNAAGNLGYARGVCSRFPDDAGPDAIRFTVSHDDGDTLRLYYVAERDHHPFTHGALEYSRQAAAIFGGGGR